MKINNNGMIINVEKFTECVSFYKELFKLPEMFSKVDGSFKLTCLEFGHSYLMIETGGFAVSSGKDFSQCPIKIRFNVADIHDTLKSIHQYGIDTEVIETDWGSIININDPDGNPISIRDEEGFQKDITNAQPI